MKMNRMMLVAGLASFLSFGISQSLAQDDQAQGRRARGNFDPAQMRERAMERVKEQMEITDDAEWKAVQPLIQKVMEARMAAGAGGMGRGMFGPPRRGGDNAGGGGGDQPQRRGGFFGQPSPEAEALQKAIDGKASNAELKAAIAKYQDSRKAKQAELEKAQAELRKVLSVKQEAVATLDGLL